MILLRDQRDWSNAILMLHWSQRSLDGGEGLGFYSRYLCFLSLSFVFDCSFFRERCHSRVTSLFSNLPIFVNGCNSSLKRAPINPRWTCIHGVLLIHRGPRTKMGVSLITPSLSHCRRFISSSPYTLIDSSCILFLSIVFWGFSFDSFDLSVFMRTVLFLYHKP